MGRFIQIVKMDWIVAIMQLLKERNGLEGIHVQGLFFTFLMLQLCEKDGRSCACSLGLLTSGVAVFFFFVEKKSSQ